MKLYFENIVNEDLDLDPMILGLADKFWYEAKDIARKIGGYHARWGSWLTDTYKWVIQPVFFKNENKNSITYKMEFNSCEDHYQEVTEAVKKVKELLNDPMYAELRKYLKISKDGSEFNGRTKTYALNLTLSASAEERPRTATSLQKAARAKQIKNYFEDFVTGAVGAYIHNRKKVSGGWIGQSYTYNNDRLFFERHHIDAENGYDENGEYGVKPAVGWLSKVQQNIKNNFSRVSSKSEEAEFTPLFNVDTYEGKFIPRGEFQFEVFIPEPDDWSEWS